MNWQSYMNNIQVKWDSNVCTPVNKVGGRRRFTKRRRTKKKQVKRITKGKSRKSRKYK